MSWYRQVVEGTLFDQALADQTSIEAAMKTIYLEAGSMLSVLDNGVGDTIIFVPTIPELNFVYAPQIEQFSTQYRLVLYNPHLSLETFVRIPDRAHELEQLMNALGIESAHFVAWSDAGSVAYQLAKQAPDRCKSLTFLGLPDRYTFPALFQTLSRILLLTPIEDFVPQQIIASILGFFFAGPIVKARWIRHRALEIPKLARLFKYSILPCMFDHHPIMGEVITRSIIVVGDNDRVVSVKQAKQMAQLLSNTQEVITIPDGEHLLSYTSASAVNTIISEFISHTQTYG